MNPSITTITTAILLFSMAAFQAVAQSNFRVLRGENQPKIGDLRISNTPELLQFSALTGERVTIRLLEDTQTAIVQNNVNVVMDCSSLIESAGKLLAPAQWTRLTYFEGEDGVLSPKGSVITIYPGPETDRLRAEGELSRFLNISRTNIANGAERADNGLYTCTVCTGTGCRSSSVMLFLIGAPPRLDFDADNATEDNSTMPYADKHYRVGADFCMERGSFTILELSCNVFGDNVAEHISIPFPLPSRKWYKDGVLLYSVENLGRSIYRGKNPNFYTEKNVLLDDRVVYPSPLIPLQNGELILVFSPASELVSPTLAPQGTTNETLSDDVFDNLLGRWRCEVENMLGMQAAETIITEC